MVMQIFVARDLSFELRFFYVAHTVWSLCYRTSDKYIKHLISKQYECYFMTHAQGGGTL